MSLARLVPPPSTPVEWTRPQPPVDPYALGPGLVTLIVLGLVVLGLVYLVVRAPRVEEPPAWKYRPERRRRRDAAAAPDEDEEEGYRPIPKARVVRRDRRRDPT